MQSSASHIDVAAAFEAVAPRAPIEVWTGAMRFSSRFVAGLAQWLSEADVRDLDGALTRRARGATRRMYTARCFVNGDRYQCNGDVNLSGTHSMIDRLSLGGKELTRLQLAQRRGHAARA